MNVEYQNQHGKKNKAQVMPLALVQQGGAMYLVVQYEGVENYRHLALHRIKKAAVSTFSFEYPKDFNLKHYQEQGNFGFGDGSMVKLTFSISHSAGFHLTETPLSKDQQILEETEAFYRIQATVPDNEMLTWWIRKFGTDIWDIKREAISE